MTKNWVEINDDAHVTYNTNSQIKFKTTMPKSSLCDYSDAYILVKGTISVRNTGTDANPNSGAKKVISKNCAPFTDCISKINNTEVVNAKDINVVMTISNLIDYRDIPSKTAESLGQHYRNGPALTDPVVIDDFPSNATKDLFRKNNRPNKR